MTEFAVNAVDPAGLADFAAKFRYAYRDKDPSESLDWNEIQEALAAAVHALGEPARAFMAVVDPCNADRPADPDVLVITYPSDASSLIRAAAALLYAYRTPDAVDLDDVDFAYAALAGDDLGHAPSP
jgi:hypothetical protein